VRARIEPHRPTGRSRPEATARSGAKRSSKSGQADGLSDCGTQTVKVLHQILLVIVSAEHLVAPLLRFDLKHHACARGAAAVSSPVEVAGPVADHARVRSAAIGPAREDVQHRLMAGRVEFEHHARARCAATVGSPVEATGRVEDHTCVGVAAIVPAREAVQHGLMASRIDFEHHAESVTATLSNPVEVAG